MKTVPRVNVDVIKEKILSFSSSLKEGTLEWFSIVLLHCAFLPTYFAVFSGLSDRLPSLDIAVILWLALLLLFLKSVIIKDVLNIITIGLGFIFQIFFLGFIFFR